MFQKEKYEMFTGSLIQIANDKAESTAKER